jgi:hypothetical protein
MSAMTALRTSLSVLLATLVVGLGTPAFADSPSTWNAGPSRTALENVVFFGGAVVGLFILVSLFALLTARNNFVPEPPEPGVDLEKHDHH